MSSSGLGRVKTPRPEQWRFGPLQFDAEAADGGIVGGGYALIASRSRRTPIMFITRVML